MKKPVLITTIGFPGSGKSYFSERLAKKDGFIHLSSDKTRWTLFSQPTFSAEETQGVFRLMDLLTKELLQKGISVIYDVNMNFRAHRKRVRAIAQTCGARQMLVWIQTEIPVAEKRLERRSQSKDVRKKLLYPPVPKEILHKLKDQLEPPTTAERVAIIDGHQPFSVQYQQYQNALRRH